MKSTLSITSIIFTVGLLTLPLVWGDNIGEHEESEEHEYKQTSTVTASSPLYSEECGSCHMAYPAELLPTRSWKKMMSNLENHFGDNAELDAQTQLEISKFLISHSTDETGSRKAHKFTRSVNSADTPLRISQLAYFKHEHDEIPRTMVSKNPEVKSFSQCNSCHSRAEQGHFNEDDVKIPGFGRWDD